MRILLLSILSFLCTQNLYSQDFSFGKIKVEDFEKVNIHANAVVLHEYGKAAIEYDAQQGSLILRNYVHTKILIINKQGFSNADFSIPVYRDKTEREIISAIKGTTYNLVDGKIIETDLKKNSILTEKSSDRLSFTKIAFPDIKEGSIIELKYTIESPFLYNLQTWDFQSTIPKLHSEFVTDIPNICVYNVRLNGGYSLSSRKIESYDTRITSSTGDILGERTIYIMQNVPAFKEEEYMTASKNFTSRLTFELARFSIPFGPSYNYSSNWADVDKSLKESDYFGKELKRDNLFKETIQKITQESDTEYDKANKIYTYIKQNIKWNKKYGVYVDNGIKKALEEKNGNVADINIALICALKAANLEATPIILSTRPNGIPSLYNPSISDYNYTIAHLKIGEDSYFLDATDLNTAFGLIPLRCINYEGRHILENGSIPIPLVASYTSKTAYSFNGVLNQNGSLSGDLTTYYMGYANNNKRDEINNFNSLDEYFEDYAEKTSHINIEASKVNQLNDANTALFEEHNISVNEFASTNNNALTFNPFIIGKISTNPFNLDERTYPIDLGSSIQTTFDFTIELPEGYTLSEQFKNLNMALPNKDAIFKYVVKEENNILNIQCVIFLQKPLFPPDEYLNLKEFFSRIIQSQKIDLTLIKS